MELTIRNFKAVKYTAIPLSNFGIFQGPNGSGKTTILQAFILAVTGKLPGINDKELFSDFAREGEEVNDMAVGLITKDFSFVRTWICKEKFDNAQGKRVATVSQEIDITPFITGEGLTQKKERINELISLNPISVDIENFLGLSDNKRRDFFYNLGEAEKLTWDRIKKHLEPVEIAVDTPIREAWRSLMDTFDFAGKKGEPDIEMILTLLTQSISNKTNEKRQAEATVRRMIEVKAKRDTVAGHLNQLEKTLLELQNQKTELEKNIDSGSAKAEVLRLTDERKNEYLQRKIALEKETEEDLIDLTKLNKDLDELQKKVDGSSKEYERNRNRADKASEEADEKVEDLKTVREKLLIDTSLKLGKEDDIQVILKVHRLHLSKKSYEYLESKRKEIKEEGTEGENVLKAMDDQIKDSSEKAKSLRYDYDLLIKAERDKQDEFTAISNNLKRELSVLVDRIPKAEAELKKVNETITASDKLPPPEEVVDISVLQDRLEGINQSIAELQPQVNEKRSEMELLVVQTDAEGDLQQAEIDLYCLKSMQKALGPSGLKGELVKATLSPIKDKANKALRILGYDREFDFQMIDSRGNECFNFGWKTDTGRLIKFNALSTGEQTVLLTALVAVICSASDRDVKFLWMDNVEVISNDHEGVYFTGLPALAELCELDYFYVCTSKDFDLEALDPLRTIFPATWQVYVCPLEE